MRVAITSQNIAPRLGHCIGSGAMVIGGNVVAVHDPKERAGNPAGCLGRSTHSA